MIKKNYKNLISKRVSEKAELSEMIESERIFLSGLINEYKPEKIVEIGVATGLSSLVILDAIKDFDNAHLYSFDYSTQYYRDKTKKTGFAVDEFPDLTEKWTLKTGAMTCALLDDSIKDIDFCLIDTVHSAPGEFLDYLQILPRLKKNAIVVIHDISYHIIFNRPFSNVCFALFSTLSGEKFLPQYDEYPNMGAVLLEDNAYENAFDIFYSLLLPWLYKITPKDYKDLKNYFSKNYDKELVSLFEKAYKLNSKALQTKPERKIERSLKQKLALTFKYLSLD